MVTPIAARAQGPRTAQQRTGDCDPTTPATLAAVLVAALEQALQAAQRLLGALDTAEGSCARREGSALVAPDGYAGGLSRRETEVLHLLAVGQSNREIAQTLFLSPRTVQRHVANLYPKIGAHCRAEAVVYALRHGLV